MNLLTELTFCIVEAYPLNWFLDFTDVCCTFVSGTSLHHSAEILRTNVIINFMELTRKVPLKHDAMMAARLLRTPTSAAQAISFTVIVISFRTICNPPLSIISCLPPLHAELTLFLSYENAFSSLFSSKHKVPSLLSVLFAEFASTLAWCNHQYTREDCSPWIFRINCFYFPQCFQVGCTL